MRVVLVLVMSLIALSCNPFAPGLDTSSIDSDSILGDPTTVDGIFQNFRYAYTFRDTTIYGQLLNTEFVFVYRDYDRGVDISWGRDEELRTTNGLFQNVQRLDLVWNDIISQSIDSMNTAASINRNFNLTVTFNPSDIVSVFVYASMTLARRQSDEPLTVMRWRDVSNF